METWVVPLLSGIGVALIGLAGTLVGQWMQREKTRAEARSTDADYGTKVTASAVVLINELQDEVVSLRDRQRTIEAERDVERGEMVKLRREVAALRAEVESLRAENLALREEIVRLKNGG